MQAASGSKERDGKGSRIHLPSLNPKFKIYTQDPVIGYDARTRKPVRAFRKYEKPFNWYKLFFWVVMILMFIAMTSCTYMPVYDPKG